jgi:hypothetical protein
LKAEDIDDSLDDVIPPIGGIIPWLKSFTGVPQTLPDSYVECNGQIIYDADSPLNLKTLPNLNSTNTFLRGNTTSGGTGGGAHGHTASTLDHSANVNGAGTSGFSSSTLTLVSKTANPSYMDVVYIMRKK